MLADLFAHLRGNWTLERTNADATYTLIGTATFQTDESNPHIIDLTETGMATLANSPAPISATRKFRLHLNTDTDTIDWYFNDHRQGIYLTLAQDTSTSLISGTHHCADDTYTLSLNTPHITTTAPKLTRFQTLTTITGPKKNEVLMSTYKKVQQ